MKIIQQHYTTTQHNNLQSKRICILFNLFIVQRLARSIDNFFQNKVIYLAVYINLYQCIKEIFIPKSNETGAERL